MKRSMLGGVVATALSLEKVLGSYSLFQWLFTAGCVMPVIFLSFFWYYEETPGWLISKGRTADALKSIRALHGETATIFEIETAEEPGKGILETIREIWREKDLRRAQLVGILMMVGTFFSGANAVIVYSTQTFILVGIPADQAGYCSLGINIVNWLATLASASLIEITGHRVLMIGGIAGMLITNVFNTVFMSFPGNQFCAYGLLVSTFLYIIFMDIGPGTIPWEAMTRS